MVYTLRFFFSSKCSSFHNFNIFGSCIIRILYTGRAKIKKKFRRQKVNWYVRVKQSLYRPGQTPRIPGGWGSQFQDNRLVSLRRRPLLLHSKYPWYSFLLEAEYTPVSECGQWKIPVTPSGVKPRACGAVPQRNAPPRANWCVAGLLLMSGGPVSIRGQSMWDFW